MDNLLLQISRFVAVDTLQVSKISWRVMRSFSAYHSLVSPGD